MSDQAVSDRRRRDGPRGIFVVGCPRSGTTLLQSMLAAHPDVLGFPETHALYPLVNRNPLLKRARVRSSAATTAWAAMPGLGVPVRGRPPRRVPTYVKAVIEAFDEAAETTGGRVWAEKTPAHLRAVRLIRQYVPNARVVHVVREGVATVTSLYAVTQNHGVAWDGERTVGQCLQRWSNDLSRTARWAALPGQHVVAYEALVADPRSVLAALVVALDLTAEGSEAVEVASQMAVGYRAQAGRLAAVGESWKADVAAAIQDRSAAHAGLLTEAQLEQVEAGVAAAAPLYEALPFVAG